MMIIRNYLFESGDKIEINYTLVRLLKLTSMRPVFTQSD